LVVIEQHNYVLRNTCITNALHCWARLRVIDAEITSRGRS
jgi:hypothetical protein